MCDLCLEDPADWTKGQVGWRRRDGNKDRFIQGCKGADWVGQDVKFRYIRRWPSFDERDVGFIVACKPSFLLSVRCEFFLIICFRRRIGIGTSGSVRTHMKVHGRRPSCEVPLPWNSSYLNPLVTFFSHNFTMRTLIDYIHQVLWSPARHSAYQNTLGEQGIGIIGTYDHSYLQNNYPVTTRCPS